MTMYRSSHGRSDQSGRRAAHPHRAGLLSISAKRWRVAGAGCGRCCRLSDPRWSRRSRTWTRATSPPTFRQARATAIRCCGWWRSRTSSRCCSSPCPAKLGLVTGRNLAELCRAALPAVACYAMWGISEIAAMATDLAEFVGGAIGVSLLTHLPMMPSMLITAAITYGLLQFEKRGFRPLELAIAALVGVIGLSYLAELLIAPVHWPSGDQAHVHAEHARQQCVDDFGRHHRRDRDAACAVPAFGAHAESREAAQRTRAREAAAVLEYRGRRRRSASPGSSTWRW